MTTLTKLLISIGVVALVLLCVVTFIPYPPAIQTARDAGFSIETIETGLQLNFERRIFFWVYTAIDLGLIYLLAMGLCRRVADRLLVWTRGYRIPAALGMGFIYLVLHDLLTLPIGIGRFYHSHAWGLANPSYDLPAWLRDHYLAFAINIPWEVAVVAALYAGLIVTPRVWWLLAPIGMSILGVAYVFLAPILINPLFNDFTPLRETEWRGLQPRVQALIDEAEIPVQEILVMDASRQSTHTNAYFTGFGSTRRIVLYDTLLKNHTPEEIESVLAHEIGHWQHDHIVKGMAIAIVASVFGFLILHLFLRGAVRQAPWNLAGIADPAGLWLILLLISVGSWLAMPAENMISRYFERQADEVSLDLGKQPQAFIDSERKMAVDNKSNVAPTPWNVWLFASHPPTVERIRMAEDWEKAHKT